MTKDKSNKKTKRNVFIFGQSNGTSKASQLFFSNEATKGSQLLYPLSNMINLCGLYLTTTI